MEQIEKRSKLSDKQFTLLMDANKGVQQALQEAERAQGALRTVSTLILDAKGLPEGLQARIDEATKELVWTEDAPKPEETPKGVAE